jgi:tRNA(adenine34) deaminase
MRRALDAARAAAEAGEVPVGAVLVRGDAVVAVAGNAPRRLSDPTAHAEMLAIRDGARLLGAERLEGCDLWVTLEPCPMCAGAIAHARVRRLYYGASDPKGGGVEHGPRVFAHPTCHHRPDVYPGIGEGEAAALLRGFFAARR